MDITDNQVFKEWISATKVVDEQGRPLRIFHGSYNPMPELGRLSHFGTRSAAESRLFDTSHDHGGMIGSRIFSGFLRITNPFHVTDCWHNSLPGAGGEKLFALANEVFSRKEVLFILQPLHDENDGGWSEKVTAGTLPQPPQPQGWLAKALAVHVPLKKLAGMDDSAVNASLAPYLRGSPVGNHPACRYFKWGDAAWKVMMSERREKLATERFVSLLKLKGYDGIYYENAIEGGRSYITFSRQQFWVEPQHCVLRKDGSPRGPDWVDERIPEALLSVRPKRYARSL